jgi:acyl carrier protein
MQQIEKRVREFITENFFVDATSLEGDASLVGSGVIDSTGVMEIILFLEESFEIQLPDEDAVPANLDSINNLTRYIHGRTVQVTA